MNRTSRSRPLARWSVGWWALLLLAGVCLALPSCAADGTFLGYSAGGNFDTHYKTISVPTFQNRTFYPGLEFDLTQLVVQQIERMSPYKVVQDNADLELTGRIVSYVKNVVLENPNNEQRVADTVMVVEVVLRDLRTGEILSKPPKRPGGPLALETVPGVNEPLDGALPSDIPQPSGIMPFPNVGALPVLPNPQAVMNDNPTLDPLGPQLPPPPAGPAIKPFGPGIIIRSTGTYIPELGQSLTTAEQRVEYNIAVQLVNMLEKPW